ncbi:hypothetical protein A7Q10_09605 [Methylacidiphilum caldifontis]|uniref:Tetratricopeptide repeat protein n=1 Tax=Methylacidiphilum caldifontis TaxID=2795386 RepID=A0A4Y8P9D9_9BACT|nr:hypothetical protein A7Q10_09605 [Methylacidiphilum caldifontis]
MLVKRFLFFLFFFFLCSSSILFALSKEETNIKKLQSLFQSGRLEEASTHAYELLHHYSSCDLCWRVIGESALCFGKLEEAKEAFQHALKILPEDKKSLALLREVYIRQDRYLQAAQIAYALGEYGQGDLLKSFGEHKPFLVESKSPYVKIQFKEIVPYPVIEVELSGIKARFMIDTGSTYVLLSPRLAKKAAVELFRKEKEQSAQGSFWIQWAKIPSLSLGGATIKNIPALVHSLLDIPRSGMMIDGILGENFLSHFIPSFDLRGRWKRTPKYFILGLSHDNVQIPFEKGSQDEQRKTQVPFLIGPAQTLLVQASINRSFPLLFLLDTATPGYFACSPSMAKFSKIWIQKNFSNEEPYIHRGRGTNLDVQWELGASRSSSQIGQASQIEIREEKIHGSLPGIVGSLPYNMDADLGFYTGGTIGFGFFYDKQVTIDYKNQQLYFLTPMPRSSKTKR